MAKQPLEDWARRFGQFKEARKDQNACGSQEEWHAVNEVLAPSATKHDKSKDRRSTEGQSAPEPD
jgi:hypothetical protein